LPTSPILRAVRAVFFDAVGTLIHPSPSAAESYAAVGQRYGSKLNVEEIKKRFHAAFRRQEQNDDEQLGRTSEAHEIARWRTIVAEVLTDVIDRPACFAELYRHFSLPASWRVEPETAETLQRLHDQGFVLGLASNYDHRLRDVVRGIPALVGITHIVISSEVGWRKPNGNFFAALCRRVLLPPERVLLVGDDLANDFRGAQEAGLRAVLFDPQGTGGSEPAIRRLAELVE
jgi:putative hydrolase of the HAD superfamily